MNYLAHAYLSFNDSAVLVGNMISDFVKGRKKDDYPEAIRKGIALHRAIDAFTDAHAATRDAKEVFRPHYRLYSAAFVDVVYDHFLANDPHHFTAGSLREFAAVTYGTLEEQAVYFPERFARMFPYMREQDWLFHYSSTRGTEKSLGGVVRRAAYLEESDTAARLFHEHYEQLRDCYKAFFPDLYGFARAEYGRLVLP
ncbi:MAG TPA: ACP phosphodiesterase [Lacibacter sp.]|nr:ACP phosphodiesterase [Lacibacter sp.]HMO88456.1 ACP phosphodiesterase [Lacibacter sp.]HMP86637.1 ACP phosphodiesterase [Lacibacter sp.]